MSSPPLLLPWSIAAILPSRIRMEPETISSASTIRAFFRTISLAIGQLFHHRICVGGCFIFREEGFDIERAEIIERFAQTIMAPVPPGQPVKAIAGCSVEA